ncbi:MAG: hypothetical protein WBP89_18870 [Sedimenticolaceae bacterium]
MSGVGDNRRFLVFYRDYLNDVSITSGQPESLPVSRVVPLARRLLVAADNFLGIVDRNDVILQCYTADDPGKLMLELIYPEAPGCLRLAMPREQALDFLDHLPDVFDDSLLQGAQYIA